MAVDPHVVSGLRVGIAADIGNASHIERCGPALGFGDLESLLVGRQCKKAADPAAGRSIVGAFVPDRLLRDRGAGGLQIGAAAAEAKRARTRKIGVIGTVSDAIIRPAVAGRDAYGYPHCGRSLESLVVC